MFVWKKSCKYKQKRAGAAISDKIGFKQKLLPEAEKIFYNDKDPLGRQNNNKYIYTSQWKPNPTHIKQKLTELEGKIDNSIITVEDCNPSL